MTGNDIRTAREAYLTRRGFYLCRRCASERKAGEEEAPRMRASTDVVTHHEVDSPVHCEECEALLPMNLTPHGAEYVARSILQHLYHGEGRREVVAAWARYYECARPWNVAEYASEGRERTLPALRDCLRNFMEDRDLW